jgi:hypothetical protein
VVEAIGDRADVIVVAQSMAAFTAPMLCDRVDVRLLVLVAPTSGSTGGTATTTSPPPAGH